MAPVPFFPIHILMPIIRTIPRRYSYFATGWIAGVWKTLAAGAKVSGPAAEELERSLAAELQIPRPVATASGRLALRLILETSDLPPGAEILVPGYTFGLVYPSIAASGFVPVPVDIDPDTFQMDPAKAEAAITPRTGAVLATHLFGEPCEIDRFAEICRRRRLLLIEDCAQAIGASSRDRGVGTIGDAGFTSFDVSKALQGFRGGAVFSRDESRLERIRELVRRLGQPEKSPAGEIIRTCVEHALLRSALWRGPMILISNESVQKLMMRVYRKNETLESAPGAAVEMGPATLPDAMAVMVRMNLETLGRRLERRRAIRALYSELLGATLQFQRADPENEPTAHMAVAKSPVDVFKLRRFLAVRGIDCGIGNEIADNCLNRPGSVVDEICGRTIALPIHERLSDADVRLIARAVNAAIEKLS